MKITKITKVTFRHAHDTGILAITLRRLINTLLLCIFLNFTTSIIIALVFEISSLIKYLIEFTIKQFDRNPMGNVHGSLNERITYIKHSLVETLRHSDLTDKEKANMVKQYDSINEDLRLIEKSAYGKVFSGMLNNRLMANFNIEDMLASHLNELENNALYIQKERFLAGNESLIQEQLNDPIIGDIGNIYDKVSKLSRIYFNNKSIHKKEFDHDFKNIVKDFNSITYKRFGIHINLRNSNTFAIIPIFNPDQIDLNSFKAKQTDVTHGIKQIKDFTKWLDGNELILDKKEARFLNMPLDYYIPLFISTKHINSLSKEEFTAIILHEIGHVFTLLEMYTKTSLTTSILLTNFLRNKTTIETSKDLTISKQPKNNEHGLQLIFDKVKKDIRNIAIGSMVLVILILNMKLITLQLSSVMVVILVGR